TPASENPRAERKRHELRRRRSPPENRADPNAPEEKKLRVLMRGVKENIFGGLVRSPPTTVEGFVTEATNIERALQARAAHYYRVPGVADFSSSGYNPTDIREIIRDVVREEIGKLLPAAASPATPLVAEIDSAGNTNLAARRFSHPYIQ
ncbi:hypothetical protein ISCGN_006435, partial [Ixodes scapularis]